MSFLRWSTLASFIIGLMAGAAALNLVSGLHLDRAELEIQQLSAQLAEKSEQIKALEEAVAQHEASEKLGITEIEVHVSFKDPKLNDELNSLEIGKTIKNLLKTLRGREVSTVDPILLFNIVDGRLIQVSDTEFIVTVKSVLVSKKLILHVEAAEKVKTVNTHQPVQEKFVDPNQQGQSP